MRGARQTGAALLLVVVLGCSNPSSDPRMQSTVSPVAGHTHVISITYRQFNSGIRTYFLYEADGHAHTVELTLDQLAYLALGFPVAVESSYEALHSHAVLLQIQDF